MTFGLANYGAGDINSGAGDIHVGGRLSLLDAVEDKYISPDYRCTAWKFNVLFQSRILLKSLCTFP